MPEEEKKFAVGIREKFNAIVKRGQRRRIVTTEDEDEESSDDQHRTALLLSLGRKEEGQEGLLPYIKDRIAVLDGSMAQCTDSQLRYCVGARDELISVETRDHRR